MKLLMFVRYETLGDTLVTPDKHHTTAAQHDSDHTAAPGLIHWLPAYVWIYNNFYMKIWIKLCLQDGNIYQFWWGNITCGHDNSAQRWEKKMLMLTRNLATPGVMTHNTICWCWPLANKYLHLSGTLLMLMCGGNSAAEIWDTRQSISPPSALMISTEIPRLCEILKQSWEDPATDKNNARELVVVVFFARRHLGSVRRDSKII